MPRPRKDFEIDINQKINEITDNIGKINTKELLEEVIEYNAFLSKFFNIIMSKERDNYLSENQTSGNGHYERSIASSIGKIDVSVPRTRDSIFRPAILPDKYQRYDDSFENFVKDLLLSGINKTKIKEIIKSRNLPFSETLIDEISSEIEVEFRRLFTKQLPDEILALFIDCKIVECIKENGTIGKVYIYQVYGINWNAEKEIYHFEISEEQENSKKWLSIFSKLVQRGLRKILLIVSDNLSGITNSIDTIFSEAIHQLCIVHLLRNVFKHFSKDDAKKFKEYFEIIKTKDNFSDALDSFLNLCSLFEKDYPSFIAELKKHAKRYVAFTKLPKSTHKYLYSTNQVEGINNNVEIIRKHIGSYFRSELHLLLCYAIWYKRLKNNNWFYPHPIIKGYIRDLRKIFISIYNELIE